MFKLNISGIGGQNVSTPDDIPTVNAPVIVVADATKATVPAPEPGKAEDKLPSKTTPEQDRTTLSQRRVNLIWEITQAVIAVTVTVSSLIVAAVLTLRGNDGSAAFLLLSNAFFLIIGFYFSRTNHTKVGGVGDKELKER